MYEKFCERNRRLVHGLSWRFIYICERDPTIERDDLVQEGYLALIDAAESYTGTDEGWGAYAYAVMKNRYRKMLRIRSGTGQSMDMIIGAVSLDKPVTDEEDTAMLNTIPDATILPFDEAILNDEMSKALHNAVDQLDTLEKMVISWLYFDRLSFTEVGKLLNMQRDNVRRIRDRAFGKLRRDSRLIDYKPVNHKTANKRRGYL